jgi:DNA mismatch repair protein MutL
MPIRLLPPGIAALIAAGEVIERPASVIRELVDNALDAAADVIEIAVRGAACQHISVTDNGTGMDPADLALCLEHHATSKLPDNRVRAIATLGFRGEALASIASVAHVNVVSRPKGQDVAFSVGAAAGGKATKPRPCAGGEGTTVTVSDLFFSHPARLKFLKSEQVERARIVETVQKAALAHPEVEFRLSAGRSRIRFSRVSDPAVRMRDVLSGDFAADSVEVRMEADGYGVVGLAALPSALTPSSSRQVFMVNGRAVSDRGLAAAVASVYRTLTGARETAPVALHLSIPAGEVDVNVHPTKSEVRFLDPARVGNFLREAVSSAIDAAGFRTPKAVFAMARRLAEEGTLESPADRRRLPLGRFLGQVDGKWLVAETADGLVLIDQHAAHERVVLERLKSAVSGGDADMVSITPPARRDLTAMQAAMLCESVPVLRDLGFSVSMKGDTAVMDGYPAMLEGCVPSELLTTLVDACIREVAEGVVGEALWEILATAACRAAIKAGQSLDHDRADRLLREMESVPQPGHCNHGRPTVAFLKSEDIARLFGR